MSYLYSINLPWKFLHGHVSDFQWVDFWRGDSFLYVGVYAPSLSVPCAGIPSSSLLICFILHCLQCCHRRSMGSPSYCLFSVTLGEKHKIYASAHPYICSDAQMNIFMHVGGSLAACSYLLSEPRKSRFPFSDQAEADITVAVPGTRLTWIQKWNWKVLPWR